MLVPLSGPHQEYLGTRGTDGAVVRASRAPLLISCVVPFPLPLPCQGPFCFSWTLQRAGGEHGL